MEQSDFFGLQFRFSQNGDFIVPHVSILYCFSFVTNRPSKGSTVKDVPADKFIAKLADHFKRTQEIVPPEWSDIVKTAPHKQLCPNDEDWFYVRAGTGLYVLYCTWWFLIAAMTQNRCLCNSLKRGLIFGDVFVVRQLACLRNWCPFLCALLSVHVFYVKLSWYLIAVTTPLTIERLY